MNLWIRAGDADGYNSFGEDFDAAAEYLRDMGVIAPLERFDRFSVWSPPGFEGLNYISIFWGEDKEPTPVKDLSQAALAYLNSRLMKVE